MQSLKVKWWKVFADEWPTSCFSVVCVSVCVCVYAFIALNNGIKNLITTVEVISSDGVPSLKFKI